MNYTAYLEGKACDDKHRKITDILRYNSIQLELTHDYIQRVFPTKEVSRFSKIDIITDEDLANFKASEVAQQNVRAMYQKMLCFWKINDTLYQEWGKNAPLRLWNRCNNHNHWRMTRILKSLKMLGMEQEFNDFSLRLSTILELRKINNSIRITNETIKLWNENMR